MQKRQKSKSKSAHGHNRFRYQLVRATSAGELQPLNDADLTNFEAKFPRVAARWLSPAASGEKTWQALCSSLLTKLTNQKVAYIFMEPVDPVKLNIPDYFAHIKEPMDLGAPRRSQHRNPWLSVAAAQAPCARG